MRNIYFLFIRTIFSRHPSTMQGVFFQSSRCQLIVENSIQNMHVQLFLHVAWMLHDTPWNNLIHQRVINLPCWPMQSIAVYGCCGLGSWSVGG